jgi:UDP-N-acetylmuramoyl-tripeptide--D-alanyl-D-alanine ligase
MGKLILDEIVKATGGSLLSSARREFAGLSTDSRTIREGELFVALKGPTFDGHEFLADALAKGAGGVVHRLPAADFGGKTIIRVNDTLKALHDIARYLRGKCTVPVIAVTGTNGKTTTKELIASVFGQGMKVLKTRGNLNNHIGLPLCLAGMEGDEEVMVLEMGSNAEGDIRVLCDIARPDFAVVTNVGIAHLEGFGSIETVRKTDLEILDFAKTACVNADDRFLLEGVRGFKGKVVTYGIQNDADVRAVDITPEERGSSFRLCLPDKKEIAIHLPLPGRFNILNALAAAAIADERGIAPDSIKGGLESFRGVPMRLEIKEFSGILVISDVYNANPASVEEAIKELVRLRKKRTVAVLGDMLELGSYSGEAHREIVRRLSQAGIDIFIAVGPEMTSAAVEFTGDCYTAEDSFSAGAVLSEIWREGDAVLIKGSRGMKMEKVLDAVPVATEGKNAL